MNILTLLVYCKEHTAFSFVNSEINPYLDNPEALTYPIKKLNTGPSVLFVKMFDWLSSIVVRSESSVVSLNTRFKGYCGKSVHLSNFSKVCNFISGMILLENSDLNFPSKIDHAPVGFSGSCKYLALTLLPASI